MEFIHQCMPVIIFIIVLLERYTLVMLVKPRLTGSVPGFIYPTDKDFLEVDYMTQHIKNDTLRYIIATHLFYCPGMSICSEQYKRPYTFMDYPCCAQCRCIGNCQAGECCPTILLNNVSISIRDPSPKMSCVYPQIAQYLETDYDSYQQVIFITQCLNRSDILECKELANTFLSAPVTSLVTDKSYLNKECALCNGENETNIVTWNGMLHCQQKYSSLDMESLAKYILEDKVCNVIFTTPKNVQVERCVDVYITECNVTGRWKLYDADIEFGCRSYTSVYMQSYKNVFCYLCNEEEEYLPMECQISLGFAGEFPLSFSALLDFNKMNRKAVPEQNKASGDTFVCAENEKYDSYADICRTITCSNYQVYDPDTFTCVQTMTVLEAMRYAVYVKLLPYACGNECCDLSGISPASLLAALHHDSNNCESVVYKKEGVCLTYFTVLYSIVVNEDSNDQISKMLSLDDEILKVYTSPKSDAFVMFKVIVIGPDFIPRNLVPEQRMAALELELDLAPWNFLLETEMATLDLKTVHNQQAYNESEIRIDPEDGLTILQMYREHSALDRCFKAGVTGVSYLAICPKITFHRREIQTKLGSTDITLKAVKVTFTSAMYSFKNDSVSLCAERYFEMIRNSTNLIKENYKLQAEDIAESIVSILCTIVSVISLLVTLVTYSIFRQLRSLPGQNNMALCLTLLLAHVMYPYAYHLNVNKTLCTIAGISIHFFWLSAVFWMNVCCIHMFRVFGATTKIMTPSSTRKPFIIYCLWSSVGPCVCICTNILVSFNANDGVGYGGPLCYITSQKMIFYTFGLPVACVVLSNFIMFIVVVVKLQRTANMETSSNYERSKLKIYAKLSTLTGVSWLFGFLYQWTGFRPLSFAFIILTAGQGIMILLAFVCNMRIKTMYVQRFSTSKSSADSHRSLKSTVTSTTC